MITQEPYHGEEFAEGATSDTDPVARLRVQLDELQTYIRQQWAARTDRVLLGIRRLAMLALLGMAALVALGAWIVTAVVLFLRGATDGLGTLLSGRVWLASLIVGAAALALVAAGALSAYAVFSSASKQRTKAKYKDRARDQRRRFGHTAHDRASQP